MVREIVIVALLSIPALQYTSSPANAIVCANCAQELTQLLNHAELVTSTAKAIEEVELAARHLQSLGLTVGPDVMKTMNVVRSALGTMQRVSYEVGKAEEDFLFRYQAALGLSGVPAGMFETSMSDVYLNNREDLSASLQESVRVRSMAAQAMQLQAAVDAAAGTASQASVGMLQAQQAGNSLVQNTNARLANLQSTLISYQETQVRAQQDEVVEQIVSEVAHARSMSCFGEGKSTVMVDPFGISGNLRRSN